MQSRGAVGAVAAVVLGVALPSTARAAEGSLTCGGPITRSVTLTADLYCVGDALVIGADRITLDLGGHFVDGEVAIRNRGHDGVTIRHGSAGDHAEYGVLLEGGADDNRIIGLTVSGEVAGIGVYDSDHNVIRDNESYLAGGYGIWLEHAHGNLIEANRMAKENDDGNQGGIYLMGASSANQVVRNVASSNGSDGIHVAVGSRKNLIAANSATWNTDDGIDVEDPDNLVSGNTANENQDYGIEAVPGTRGAGNSASGNRGPGQCLNVRCL